jgi:hypothetical protein
MIGPKKSENAWRQAMPHRELIDTRIAAEFVGRSFAPDETIAIVLRRTSPAAIIQRIVTLEHGRFSPGIKY